MCPNLRVYHYHKEAEHLFFLFNEEKRNRIDFHIKLPVSGPVFRFDVMNNRMFRQDSLDGCLSLSLEAGEAVLLTAVCGSSSCRPERSGTAETKDSTGANGTAETKGSAGAEASVEADGIAGFNGPAESNGPADTVKVWEAEAKEPFRDGRRQTLSLRWRISLADAQAYPNADLYKEDVPLFDINGPDALPSFSGTVRYEADFQADFWDGGQNGSRNRGQDGLAAADTVRAQIRLSQVYETAEVWLNGVYAGYALGAPYRFDVSGLLRPGTNRLVIEVTNTLAKQVGDYCSAIVPQEPGGMLADPELIYCKGGQW